MYAYFGQVRQANVYLFIYLFIVFLIYDYTAYQYHFFFGSELMSRATYCVSRPFSVNVDSRGEKYKNVSPEQFRVKGNQRLI